MRKQPNWNTRLRNATRRLKNEKDDTVSTYWPFTYDDRTKAADFASCAVGERLQGKWPFRILLGVVASKFDSLGMQFYNAVVRGNLIAAKELYKEIHNFPIEPTDVDPNVSEEIRKAIIHVD